MTAEYTAQSDVTQGRRAGMEEGSDLRAGVRDYLNRGKEKLVEMEEGLEGAVQEHPMRSILIAAGVGIVLGALISRRF